MQDLEQSYVKTFAKDDLELSTKDLSVLYGGKIQKLFDASLQFKKNTITALIGASGSGDDKSATDSSVARDTYNWNKRNISSYNNTNII